MLKEKILNEIENCEITPLHNSMGCSENWYNPYYAMKETFTREELNDMSETELNNLIRLAEAISEGLY